MATSEIDDILARLRTLFDGEYHRGERDAIERLMAAARGDVSAAPVERKAAVAATERQRVPRGAPEAFARRVLAENPDGLTLVEITNRAETPDEKAISYSAVRVSLWRAEKAGLAKKVNGKWVLTQEEKN